MIFKLEFAGFKESLVRWEASKRLVKNMHDMDGLMTTIISIHGDHTGKEPSAFVCVGKSWLVDDWLSLYFIY